MRGATQAFVPTGAQDLFQSTHPVRGATGFAGGGGGSGGDFNPRTPCGVRHAIGIQAARIEAISIHAPRAGCDRGDAGRGARGRHFNPRTPCGVRPVLIAILYSFGSFQSTHPVRGATRTGQFTRVVPVFQSTHPVRGATDRRRVALAIRRISIHAPRAGCDGVDCVVLAASDAFQSTHPVRGATSAGRCIQKPCTISIHAPRAGCDRQKL